MSDKNKIEYRRLLAKILVLAFMVFELTPISQVSAETVKEEVIKPHIAHYNAIIFGDQSTNGADVEGALAVEGNMNVVNGYSVCAINNQGNWKYDENGNKVTSNNVVGLPYESEELPAFLLGGKLNKSGGGNITFEANPLVTTKGAISPKLLTPNCKLKEISDSEMKNKFAELKSETKSLIDEVSNLKVDEPIRKVGAEDNKYGKTALGLGWVKGIEGKILKATELKGENIDIGEVTFPNEVKEADFVVIESPAKTVTFEGSQILWADKIALDNSNLKNYAPKVMWVFPNATKVVTTEGKLIPGSVIAPNAEVITKGGNVNGHLICKSLDQKGGFECHNCYFNWPGWAESLRAITGSVKLTKKDSETGKTLVGAKYKLYNNQGQIGNKVYETGKDGTLTVGNLAPGDYWFEEVEAPKGYKLDSSSKIRFTISTSNIEKPVEVTAKNDAYYGSLKVVKTNGDGSKTLSGATFEITYPNGKTEFKNTDSKGTFELSKLPIGNYSIKETVAPKGYLLNEKPVEFTINELGKTIVNVKESSNLTIKDDEIQLGTVELTKYDGDTGNTLKGATFKLTSDKGYSESKITDDNGKIIFNNLEIGTYTISEVSAPEGYITDTNLEKTFVVDGKTKEPFKFSFNNEEKTGSVTLTKVDNGDSNITLNGAEFELYNSKGRVNNETYVTKGNGSFTISGLKPGDYYLKEIKAPEGYKISNEKYNFTISIGKNTEPIKIMAKNNRIKGSVNINKVDSEDANLKLEGAKFEVAYPDGTKKNIVTSKNGSVSLIDLPVGNYSIKETEAPKGYFLNNNIKKFTINSSGQAILDNQEVNEINIKDKKIQLGDIQIIKKDSEDGSLLSGAKFSLKSKSVTKTGITDVNGFLEFKDLPIGEYTITEVEAPKGYAISKDNSITVKINGETSAPFKKEFLNAKKAGSVQLIKKDADDKLNLPLEGAIYGLYKDDVFIDRYTTGKDGKTEIFNLKPGKYSFIEEVAPKGYKLDKTPIDFEIALNEVDTLKLIEAKDNIELGSIRLTKVDGVTNTKLKGAEFNLYNSLGNNLIGSYKTSENGTIEVNNLRPGSYYFQEKNAPFGYILSNDKYEFTVTLGGVVSKKEIIAVNNIGTGSVILEKTDKETGKKLEGAIFKLLDEKGTLINTYTTDKDGIIQVSDLRPGKYSFMEEKAPEGYKLDKTLQNFEIIIGKTNEAVKVNATNTAKVSTVILQKIDSKDNTPLEGAKFKLFNEDNTEVKTGTIYRTDINGKLSVSNLREGKYYFKEIEAPKGYKLNNEKQNFTINTKEKLDPIQIRVKNEAYEGSLELIKSDSKTGFKLEGAVYKIINNKGFTQTVTTNKEGRALFNNLKIGEYELSEVTAPKGYFKSNIIYKVTVNDNGKVFVGGKQVSSLNVTDAKIQQGQVELLKTSEDGTPLEGAKFKITSDSGYVEEGITNKEGKVLFDNLAIGNYSVIETEAPKGYLLNKEFKKDIIIDGKSDKTINITAINKVIKGSVKLTKVDKDSKDKLEGATFDLFDSNNILIGNYTTSKDGSIQVNDLKPGNYYFIETASPSGYELDKTPVEFKITIDGTDKVKEVIATNTAKTGTVILNKKDSKTGEALSGASFELFNSKGKVNNSVYTTNTDGVISISNLKPGDYYFKEKEAPIGYKLSQKEYKFNIPVGENKEPIKIEASNEAYLGAATIVKTSIGENIKLPGATYRITYPNGNTKDFTTDKNGEIKLSDLEVGNYTIKEISAPKGYLVDGSSKEFKINNLGKTLYQNKEGQIINVQDKKILLGKVLVTKKDSKSGKVLEGASFEISSKTYKKQGKTDKNGQILFDKLPVGEYEIKEIEPPYGYSLNKDVIEKVAINGVYDKVINCDFENEVMCSTVYLTKVDKETRETLEGAEYALYNSENFCKGVYQTGKDGDTKSIKLEPGRYYFKEVKAPKGHTLSPKKYYFDVKLGENKKPIQVITENDSYKGSVKIVKTDESGKLKLEGAEFNLTYPDGRSKNFTTDKNGQIILSDLKIGDYLLKEVRAPKGYELNKDVKKFTINDIGETIYNNEKCNEIDVKDIKTELGKVVLTKIDSKTNKALKGAEFELFNSNNISIGKYSTGENGSLTVKNLSEGKYYFKEVFAPKGYKLNKNIFNFEMVKGKMTESQNIVVKDDILLHSVVLTKTNEDGRKVLEGAKFGLFSKENNKMLNEYTTNKLGTIEISDLRPGDYYFKELKAPEGYKLSEKEYEFKILLDNSTEITKIKATNKEKEFEKPSVFIEEKTGDSNKNSETNINIEKKKVENKEVEKTEVKNSVSESKISEKKASEKASVKKETTSNELPKTGREGFTILIGLFLIGSGAYLTLNSRKNIKKSS